MLEKAKSSDLTRLLLVSRKANSVELSVLCADLLLRSQCVTAGLVVLLVKAMKNVRSEKLCLVYKTLTPAQLRSNCKDAY